MTRDIETILQGWEYDPSTISARWIRGSDASRKVQLRLDLGVLQMEVEGRPDGSRPRGYPSLLAYHLLMERTASQSLPAERLNSADCAELQQEAVQYYYRYLAFYSLNYLEGVIQDTEHNLQIFDLANRRAESEDLVWQFLQFFPYVRMMNARAKAEKAVDEDQFEFAICSIEKGLEDIQTFWEERGCDDVHSTHEIEVLTDLLTQLEMKRPFDDTQRLIEDLEYAIAMENYERAAVIRDTLKDLEAPHEENLDLNSDP